jgi:hypothetical protein
MNLPTKIFLTALLLAAIFTLAACGGIPLGQ